MAHETQVITRLHQDVYKSLEKQLPKISAPATELEAGYLLGIQLVLGKLREGFVIGEPS